ncbi:MAG: DUF2007 domain-containing protein [bacterium]
MKFVVLKSCSDVIEANIIKGHLESEGIQCFIANEHISNLLPSMNTMKGEGPQIMVMESDYERAMELIAEQFNTEDEYSEIE